APPGVTMESLHSWLEGTTAGDVLAYHRGFVALDRGTGSRLGEEAGRELDRVAAAVLAMAHAGQVHLVQRRHGPCDYTYMVVAAYGVSGRAFPIALGQRRPRRE